MVAGRNGQSVSLGQATADASGHWSIPAAVPLADGAYTITAEALDLAGNSSNPVLAAP